MTVQHKKESFFESGVYLIVMLANQMTDRALKFRPREWPHYGKRTENKNIIWLYNFRKVFQEMSKTEFSTTQLQCTNHAQKAFLNVVN